MQKYDKATTRNIFTVPLHKNCYMCTSLWLSLLHLQIKLLKLLKVLPNEKHDLYCPVDTKFHISII